MARADPLPPEAAPTRYRLFRQLGEGGTAKVFLAVAHGPAGFEKLVVLKRLKRQLAEDDGLRAAFLHEARLSARLNHPNVVQVNEVTEHEGMPAIVMEYLEGCPLSEIILRAGGELTLPMTLRILGEAIVGLHYSHELTDYDGTALNLVHRDFTPQNVFVTFDGAVKVLDFGIARVGAGQGDTSNGVIKGKLRYMPPEQLIGERVDRRADIYAAGVMLWEAGARQRLWKDMSDAAIMNRVIHGTIPSPRTVNPACPEELERICRRALAPAQQDRYATAAELLADIEALVSRLTPRVQNVEVGRRLAVWFADFRTETRQAIEQALREDTSLSLAGQQFYSAPPRPSGEPAAFRAQGRRSAGVYAALALVAMFGIAGGVWWSGSARPGSATLASSGDAGPPRIASATLRVTAFPANATLRIDGEPVDANPWMEEFPIEGRLHEIVAEAPGYHPLVRRFRLTQNTDLVLSLEREPPPPPLPPAPSHVASPPPRHSAPAPVPSAAAAPRPDCAPPYYIDARGVKKVRAECL